MQSKSYKITMGWENITKWNLTGKSMLMTKYLPQSFPSLKFIIFTAQMVLHLISTDKKETFIKTSRIHIFMYGAFAIEQRYV